MRHTAASITFPFFNYYYHVCCSLILCLVPDLIDTLIVLICDLKLYLVLLVSWDGDYVL